MPTDTFACPECHAALRRSLGLQTGEVVMCPRCRHLIAYPDPRANPRPAGPEAKATRRPSSPSSSAPPVPPTAFTETLTLPGPATLDEDASPPRNSRDLPPPIDGSEEDEDYPRPPWRMRLEFDAFQDAPLDSSAWFRCAREHWGSIVGPTIAFCLVYGVILVVFFMLPCIGIGLGIFVLPPLQAGVSIVALAQLKGKRWTFADFFSGFHWGSLIALAIYTLLVVMLLFPVVVAVYVLLDCIDNGAAPPEYALIALGVIVVGGALFALLYTRLFTFALPLVLDRNCGPSEALHGSWALTRGRFWNFLTLNVLLWLINLGGAMCFLLGLMLTLPFTALVWNAAYLLLAGTQPPLSGHERVRQEQNRYDAF